MRCDQAGSKTLVKAQGFYRMHHLVGDSERWTGTSAGGHRLRQPERGVNGCSLSTRDQSALPLTGPRGLHERGTAQTAIMAPLVSATRADRRSRSDNGGYGALPIPIPSRGCPQRDGYLLYTDHP